MLIKTYLLNIDSNINETLTHPSASINLTGSTGMVSAT